MSEQSTEYDSPWKEVVREYFEEFMAFFFPQAHQDIQWTKQPEFMDKELQQVVRDAELGQRFVDKLVKVWRGDGEEAWVLIHLEVQSQEESEFAERMYVYNYRIFDRYRRNVASFAVLGDERASWRPSRFGYNLWGSEVGFRFPIVKLLDYTQQWQELEANRNPFATVVMAHLKAKETTTDPQGRKASKLYLTRRLYEQGYERQDVLNLFRFIDWVMNLPTELEQEFGRELSQYEEERRMPYVTSIERIGEIRGEERGEIRGEERGVQKGIEQSLQRMKQGLLKGIELGLGLKFGSEGLNLLPEISQIQDVDLLEAVLTGLKTANSLDELRQIYQPTNLD